MRDVAHLRRVAANHGTAIGAYATALLDSPLPWTKMRQVYRLLGLVRRYGDARVEDACRRALEAEAVDVGLVTRMLERATEAQASLPGISTVVAARFARDPDHFALSGRDRRHPDTGPDPEPASEANVAAGSSADLAGEAR